MSNLKTKGIVIRKVHYSESDTIFDILTTDGKIISFFAKGARKLKSRFTGLIQIGQVLDIAYATGKNLNYPQEASIDPENLFSFYSRSLQHMNFYTDLIVITRSVAKDFEAPELFFLIIDSFHKAEQGDALIDIYNTFLAQILNLIGAESEVKCYYTGEVIRESECYYTPEANRAISLDKKPKAIELQKVKIDQEFYKTYAQKLVLEHINSKIAFQF